MARVGVEGAVEELGDKVCCSVTCHVLALHGAVAVGGGSELEVVVGWGLAGGRREAERGEVPLCLAEGAEEDGLPVRQQEEVVEECQEIVVGLVDREHDPELALAALRQVADGLDDRDCGRSVQARCRLVQQEDSVSDVRRRVG